MQRWQKQALYPLYYPDIFFRSFFLSFRTTCYSYLSNAWALQCLAWFFWSWSYCLFEKYFYWCLITIWAAANDITQIFILCGYIFCCLINIGCISNSSEFLKPETDQKTRHQIAKKNVTVAKQNCRDVIGLQSSAKLFRFWIFHGRVLSQLLASRVKTRLDFKFSLWLKFKAPDSRKATFQNYSMRLCRH